MKKFALLFVLGLATLLMIPAHAQDTEDITTTREALPDTRPFTLNEYASGFNFPLYVTHAGDDSGRLFVVEQTGRIWIMQDGERLETPFIDLSGIVSQDVRSRYSERGLLGLAFHPNYAENGLFFVNYTDENGTSHVAEYTVSEDNPNRANPDSGRELLSVGQPYANHNGGHMSFGPDGYLYISFGDGGSADDPLNTGQDPGDLLGSLLRIDVTDYDAPQPYGIPEDNPVFDDPTFAPEVWSYGLRNVWRFSFDRATGDMYLADVGQNAIEEVNFEPVDADGGRNYGWEAYEGAQRYLGPEPQGNVVMPFTTYPHSQGCSVTGGYVYRGADIPELDAAYLYGDYCSGNIWAAYRNPDGNWQSDIIMNTNARISSFGEDESGELYVVDYNGRILRFEPAG